MAMTLGTAITNLRDRLDEATAQGWTDAALRRYINEGCRQVSRDAKCLRAEGSITVVAGTQDYTPAINIVELLPVITFQPTGQSQKIPLAYHDYAAMDLLWGTQQSVTQGYPELWTTTASSPPLLKIRLYPVPSVGGTLTVQYVRLATELATDGTADGSSIDVPQGWEDVAIDWAEYRAFMAKRQTDMAAAALRFYTEHRDELMNVSGKFVDAPGEWLPTFQPSYGMAPGYGGYGY